MTAESARMFRVIDSQTELDQEETANRAIAETSNPELMLLDKCETELMEIRATLDRIIERGRERKAHIVREIESKLKGESEQ